MGKRIITVEPSLLSADFGHITDEAKRCEEAGADAIHLDVMDGHFVPNLSMGPAIVAAVNRATDLFLDVHLMIYNPFDYVERFIEAGADRITFHLEATEAIEDIIDYIQKCNVEVGLALCPETSGELAMPYLDKLDLLLLMTVHPGFGGQAFMPEILDKIAFARAATDKRSDVSDDFKIQVDGGINAETAPQCIDAGANVFVCGTYLFGSDDMKARIEGLK